ncbi:MAG TPA: hypothetical protein VHS31_04580 [Tepidisphaeraceae bacterium]|nr:hypothetical protein [Tepidisphaeraceae bacterium]
MRVIIAPNGNRMVVYDGHNDPPGWWKHVEIPRPSQRWRWLKVMAWVIGIIVLLAFTWWILLPCLVLKAIIGLFNASSRATKGRKRWR